MRNKNISVKTKLILAFTLCSIASVSVLYLLFENTIREHLIEQKTNSLHGVASTISVEIIPFFDERAYSGYESATSLLKKWGHKSKSRIIVTSKTGIGMFDTFDEYRGVDLTYISEITEALTGRHKSDIYNFETGGMRIYHAQPIYRIGHIIGIIFISSSIDDIDEYMVNFRNLFIVTLIMSTLFTIVFALNLSKIFINPIVEVSNRISRLNKGESPKPLTLFSDDEISTLCASYNDVLTRMEIFDELRKDFMSSVSHELRTPITSMKILSDNLVQCPTDNVEIYRDFMVDINSELDHLNEIINNLLSLAYIEKSEYVLKADYISATSIVLHRAENLKLQAEKKNIEIIISPFEPVFIWADKTKLRQLIDNLIKNAIKYTETGGQIDIKMGIQKNYFVVEIKDNGIGIKEEELPYIFDRFYMADISRKRNFGSSGIGLAICKQIVNLHSGKIVVRSKLGEGSSFEVSLPIEKTGVRT